MPFFFNALSSSPPRPQVHLCVDVWQRSVWGQAPRPPCQDEQPRRRTQGLAVSQSQLAAAAICTGGEEVQKQDHLHVCLGERWLERKEKKNHKLCMHWWPLTFHLQEAGRRTGTRTGPRSPPPLTLSTPSTLVLTPSPESSRCVSDLNVTVFICLFYRT